MESLAALGRPALIAALAFAVAATVLAIAGATRHRRDLAEAACRSLVASFGFTTLAVVGMLHALFVHDFSIAYVAGYSSRSLSGAYTLSALWGGMEGSLLFWSFLLTGFSTLALVTARRRGSRLIAWSTAVLGGISVFFLLLLVLPADPFARLAVVPADGQGLNPLLQSPGMMIHPPLLYTGFVGFSIPFAFAMAALLSGRLDEGWFTSTRRWTLFAWSALSVGIVLGGAWAYTELGWGGYWAWDPVENASFMPWLTATAYLHSVVIQEKRRMFKVWNVSLILMTYALAIFGTFLTRSGILSSIHTFTEGPIGRWFLPFLALMLIGGLGIIAWRYEELRSENAFDSLLSRETAFLANNVLFLAAALAVLWGTIYPVIAELIGGVRLSVGPPFFNTVFIPIGLALVVLTGVGPLISWRAMSGGRFWKLARPPLMFGAGIVILLGALGMRSVGALVAFGACAFSAAAIAGEFARGAAVYRARGLGWPRSLNATLSRNRRRYGGYIVHLGVLLIVIGFAGSAFRAETSRPLKIGESAKLGDHTFTYAGFDQDTTAEKELFEAEIDVTRSGSYLTTLRPQRNFHKAQAQPQSEVAIRTTPIEDVYVVISSVDPDGTIGFRAFINPLTWWIWAGGVLMLLGMLVVMSGDMPVAVLSADRGPKLEAKVVQA